MRLHVVNPFLAMCRLFLRLTYISVATVYCIAATLILWFLNNKKARTVEQNGKMVRYRNREDELLFIDLRWVITYRTNKFLLILQKLARISRNLK